MTTKLLTIGELWTKHYHAEVTGSYHGDMARAFDAISRDPQCGLDIAMTLRTVIQIHMELERNRSHVGRKYFCELFGLPHERIVA